jgi:hypothetical protein
MSREAREAADAASREPGYWPNYQEPSKLARAIERPLTDPSWQIGVLNGYAQTKQVKP